MVVPVVPVVPVAPPVVPVAGAMPVVPVAGAGDVVVVVAGAGVVVLVAAGGVVVVDAAGVELELSPQAASVMRAAAPSAREIVFIVVITPLTCMWVINAAKRVRFADAENFIITLRFTPLCSRRQFEERRTREG